MEGWPGRREMCSDMVSYGALRTEEGRRGLEEQLAVLVITRESSAVAEEGWDD